MVGPETSSATERLASAFKQTCSDCASYAGCDDDALLLSFVKSSSESEECAQRSQKSLQRRRLECSHRYLRILDSLSVHDESYCASCLSVLKAGACAVGDSRSLSAEGAVFYAQQSNSCEALALLQQEISTWRRFSCRES